MVHTGSSERNTVTACLQVACSVNRKQTVWGLDQQLLQLLLQEYNVGKRIEHSYKSIFNNGNTISAVDPRRYSQRFQEFMQKVFV
jgi:hypothetical protein